MPEKKVVAAIMIAGAIVFTRELDLRAQGEIARAANSGSLEKIAIAEVIEKDEHSQADSEETQAEAAETEVGAQEKEFGNGTGNRLYIPRLDVTSQVAEGEYEDQKKYVNAWRRTFTSTPDEGGNTVIVGHRYRNNTPGYHFYDIDKIQEGDDVKLFWEGKEYTYRVFNTEEVHETAVEIEDPTDESLLTLYACDWSGKNRLVVQAKLESKKNPTVAVTAGEVPGDA